jgi:hypothetical protein
LDFALNRPTSKISILIYWKEIKTMAKKIYPSNDAEFAVWLANLVNKANGYKSELKLTSEQLDELHGKLISFNGNVALRQQKREESAAQTALVREARADLNTEVGLFNNAVKSIKGLRANILEELGLSPNEANFGNTVTAAPFDLVVTGTSDGTNRLKWKRGGNRQGTTFIIEGKIGSADAWTMIDAVTGATFAHKDQTPGVKAQYRIKAKRGDSVSGCTNTAVVYG